MSVEKILRKIPTSEKIFRSTRRVKAFTAVDCITVLSRHGFNTDVIKREIQRLLSGYRIVKVRTVEGNPDSVDLQPGKTLSANDLYIWAEEETNHWHILVGVLIVLAILLLVMFQMWPWWLRRLVSYSKYPIGGFIVFLFVMGVVRAVVFAMTYFTHPPGLWLLPNLFAECGFFESFVPAYSWADQ